MAQELKQDGGNYRINIATMTREERQKAIVDLSGQLTRTYTSDSPQRKHILRVLSILEKYDKVDDSPEEDGLDEFRSVDIFSL